MTHDHSDNDKVEDWPLYIWVIFHCILFITDLAFIILIWRFNIKNNKKVIDIIKKHKPKLFLLLSLHFAFLFGFLGSCLSTNMIFPWDIQKWEHSTSQMIYYFSAIFFALSKGFFFITYLYRIRTLYVFEAKWKYYLIFVWEWILYATIVLSVVEQVLHSCIVTTSKSGNYYVCNFPSYSRDAEVAETVVFVTAILITMLYFFKLQKVNTGDIKVRKRTMYLLLKEMILLLIPTLSSSALYIGVISNDPQNLSDGIAIWFGSMDLLVQSVCAFFMLRMNDRLYFNACHCCSLHLLKCCGMYAKGDDRMLEIAKNADFGETPVPTQPRVLKFDDVPAFNAGNDGSGTGSRNSDDQTEQDRFHMETIGVHTDDIAGNVR